MRLKHVVDNINEHMNVLICQRIYALIDINEFDLSRDIKNKKNSIAKYIQAVYNTSLLQYLKFIGNN